MRATVERATLLKGLSHVQSVVERRNTIPILSNVLIEASESGSIKLTATDLDLQIVETFSADVEVAGATTVSAHTLFEIARKLPEGSQVQLHARLVTEQGHLTRQSRHRQRFATQLDAAFARLQQTRQHTQQRRLSAAVVSLDQDHLAGSQRKIQRPENRLVIA